MAINLADRSSQPLYKEVEQEIMHCLARGEWKPGDRLPSEQVLADRFGVAVFTLRAGVQKLAEAGILLRRQGKGTFVALHRTRPYRNQYLRLYSADGMKANWDRELVSVAKASANEEIANVLRLGEGVAARAIYQVLFMLRSGGSVVGYVESAMSAKLFRGVTESLLRDTVDNLYAVFQESFGVNVIGIEEHVRATTAGRLGARRIAINASDPVLRVERVAYTYNDMPVEYRRYNVRADRYYYCFAPDS